MNKYVVLNTFKEQQKKNITNRNNSKTNNFTRYVKYLFVIMFF